MVLNRLEQDLLTDAKLVVRYYEDEQFRREREKHASEVSGGDVSFLEIAVHRLWRDTDKLLNG